MTVNHGSAGKGAPEEKQRARFLRETQNRVRLLAREENLWRPGDRLVLAVSGGADSLCMLHLLSHLRRLDGFNLVVAHLHHGMRGAAADEDSAFVRDQARAAGVPFIEGRADVPAAAAESHTGLEEAGRRARREFLDRVLADQGAAAVSTAHTRGDHVETVLMNLFRGAGLQGLQGITPRGFGARIRPLLCLDRQDTEAYCAALGLAPRWDPGNDDPGFLRNRIRTVVLPLLREQVNPSVDDAAVRLASIVSPVLEHLTQEAAGLLDAARTEESACWSRRALRDASPALQQEAVRLALSDVRGQSEDIHWSDIQRVVDLLRRSGEAPLTGGGRAVVRGRLLRIHYPMDEKYLTAPGTPAPGRRR